MASVKAKTSSSSSTKIVIRTGKQPITIPSATTTTAPASSTTHATATGPVTVTAVAAADPSLASTTVAAAASNGTLALQKRHTKSSSTTVTVTATATPTTAASLARQRLLAKRTSSTATTASAGSSSSSSRSMARTGSISRVRSAAMTATSSASSSSSSSSSYSGSVSGSGHMNGSNTINGTIKQRTHRSVPSRLPALNNKHTSTTAPHAHGGKEVHAHGVTPESEDPPVDPIDPVYRYGDCVFIVNGQRYVAAPRQALKRLGWKYNGDATSTKWDVCWAVDKIPPQLQAHQMVNRVLLYGSVTTKSGLCENLRRSQAINMDTFYPRCATIENANKPDSDGMMDMVRQYQRSAAGSLLMKYLALAARYAPLLPSNDTPGGGGEVAPSATTYPAPPSLMSASLIHSAIVGLRQYIQQLRAQRAACAHFNDWRKSVSIAIRDGCESAVTPMDHTEEKYDAASMMAAPLPDKEPNRIEWNHIVQCVESFKLSSKLPALSRDRALRHVTFTATSSGYASSSAPNRVARIGSVRVLASRPTAAASTTAQLRPPLSPSKATPPTATDVSVSSAAPAAAATASAGFFMEAAPGEPLFTQQRISDAKAVLAELREVEPQFALWGEHNVWIVKPGAMSRGRGIQCFDNLAAITKYMRRDPKIKRWVVQKYMERPLTVYRKKFDIRQWVMLSQFGQRLRMWFYEDCYLRFSSQDFDLTDLSAGIHLTNNAIQIHLAGFDSLSFDAKGNMWSAAQFEAFLEKFYEQSDAKKEHKSDSKSTIWMDVLRPRMREMARMAIESGLHKLRKRSHQFELFGIDYMFDHNLTPWMLEINMTPSLIDISVPGLTDRMTTDLWCTMLSERQRWEEEEKAAGRSASGEWQGRTQAGHTSTTGVKLGECMTASKFRLIHEIMLPSPHHIAPDGVWKYTAAAATSSSSTATAATAPAPAAADEEDEGDD